MVSPTERFAISSLLLPTHGRSENAYFERVFGILEVAADGEDIAQWVATQLDLWRTTRRPTPAFRAVVKKILFDEDLDPPSYIVRLNLLERDTDRALACRSLSVQYFDCITRLADEDELSIDEARAVLSQAGLVISASVEERQSSARIHHNLTSSGMPMGMSYRVPGLITAAINSKADLSLAEVQEIYRQDVESEPELLADLSVLEAVDYIAEVSVRVGCQTDLSKLLRKVVNPGDRHDPYLVLLHYQLITAVKYDSLLINLYEFAPRGQATDWLTLQYNEAGIQARSNPYLNNSKSVELFTHSWANTKQRLRFYAHSLVDVLQVLDGLAPLQRRTIGGLIRGLLHRIIRISETDPATAVRVPDINAAQIGKLSTFVSLRNTATLGIIEQRYVDAVTVAQKDLEGSWRAPRGLGDSVNASNLSRKKFGDIEFKHDIDPILEAYEAHGGVLTPGYVEDHLASLNYILPSRQAELEDRAPLADWTLTVIFVAHEFRGLLPPVANINGLPVVIEYQTYEDFAPGEVTERLIEAFQDAFVSRINAIETPHRVRQTAHDVVVA